MADGEHRRRWVAEHPIDVRRTISLIRRGGGDPAYRVDGPDIWRTSRMSTGPTTVRIRQLDGRTVDAVAWGPGAAEHLDTLPTCLGAGDRTEDFRPTHPVVLDAHRRFPGLRIPQTGRVMEALIPAVLEQKVVGADAFASWRRLLLAHGDDAPGPAPAGMRVPPTAQTWAALPAWEWHRAGVDPARYRAAQAVARVGDSLQRLTDTADAAAVYRGLRSIPGIGIWTAAEVGARALGDADAVPWGDYHLGSTVGTGLLGRRLTEDADIAAALEEFVPHRLRTLRLLLLSPHVRVERRGARMPRVDHRRI